ncbi:hypothetical protein D9758_012993 [Tetrapyrgos nigripes]|uniref:FAD-binding PCMH-type domain-containing protein n=1 Tax=Tetrapyrgos nigripes TaxID=182062 RepID=A0A8H5FI55_9AGAR|nr:hypothetical protein D9758_012993 [Tetrapyrgos nigripes]
MLFLTLVIHLSALVGASKASLNPRTFLDVCQEIASSVSDASGVYYPPQLEYLQGVEHYMTSSIQASACVVAPGTAKDVGKTLTIVGSSRTPFAVKGGGHATNPDASSTTGIQITMSKFDEVTYNASSQTVVYGAGLIWDDVYAKLVPQGVNVVGGRLPGVGVAGFTLGGGYSWLSNQYGLTLDNVVAFELVKPDGTVATITDDSDADLFWALRGGFNNYGIVTRFTQKAHPQGQVWGGALTFTSNQLDKVAAATAKFAAEVTDPKASIITTSDFLLTQPLVLLSVFYDGPKPPAGIFDDILAIPFLTKDVKARDFPSLIQTWPSELVAHQRGIFNVAPVVNLTRNIVDALLNESKFWGERLQFHSGSFVTYDIEPFLPSILSSSASSAWPPTRDTAFLPQNIAFLWLDPSQDEDFFDAARQSAEQIKRVALAEGQKVEGASPYPNYAIFDTPVELIYGDNLSRMRSIKAKVDPNNVMGLTGGFKI